jgi:hypothetical protein
MYTWFWLLPIVSMFVFMTPVALTWLDLFSLIAAVGIWGPCLQWSRWMLTGTLSRVAARILSRSVWLRVGESWGLELSECRRKTFSLSLPGREASFRIPLAIPASSSPRTTRVGVPTDFQYSFLQQGDEWIWSDPSPQKNPFNFPHSTLIGNLVMGIENQDN